MVKLNQRKIVKNKIILLAFSILMLIFSLAMHDKAKADIMDDISVPKHVFVQSNGENVNSVQMIANEKMILTAHTEFQTPLQYSWEILVNKQSNNWAPIYDCDDMSITLTYGMLYNCLDENNLAQIRVKVVSGTDTYLSERVLVEVREIKQKPLEIKTNETNVKNNATYKVLKSTKNAIDPIADVENIDTVTLTINYFKDTGEKVCNSYIATIPYNTPFNTTVLSPSVPGYEPRIHVDDATPTKSYVFNYAHVTEDIVVDIYYYPVEVKYEVRYLFQGIYNDDYTIDNTKTKIAYGVVGTQPDPALMNAQFEGFKKVNHYPEVIAADGSTVFQCFYDREYYLIDLKLGEGAYGVDPVYAKCGTVFVVNEPERPGYVFAGWDIDNDGQEDAMLNSIPTENVSFTALWEQKETTYTVAYWLDRGDSTSFIGSKVVDAMSASKVNGMNDLGESNVCGQEEHKHSVESNCYDCGDIETCAHDKLSCYATSLNLASSQTNSTVKTAFSTIQQQYQEPKDGYVYRYTYKRYSWSSATYYNFFFVGDTWYYLGTGSGLTIGGITCATGTLTSPSTNGNCTESSQQANANRCALGTHTHTNDCLVCEIAEHTHSNCKIDVSSYDFVRAEGFTDSNNDGIDDTDTDDMLVKGDGSTIINVYYKYKDYTLKFYYAKEEDGKYYVCGETTSFADGDSIQAQLSNVNSKWGQVKELPTIESTDTVDVSVYEMGYDTYKINNKTGKYYYLQFTDSYDSDISKKWPIGIFPNVETATTFDFGNYACFSAWNVDSGSWYDNHNSNKTLKGSYQRLDYKMLMEDDLGQTTINFLGFWENGTTGLGWNKPHKWTYEVWIPKLNGDGYELYGEYICYDNNTANDTGKDPYCYQTPTALEGFTISHCEVSTDGTYDTTYDLKAYRIKFYYTRESSYTLTFNNYGKKEEDKTQENMPYAEPLANYEYVPDYPSKLEPNAYFFDGWYTTAGCYDGTKVDFENDTMPAANMALYAKWSPIVHTVKFYNTYKDLQDGNEPLAIVEVDHNKTVQSSQVPNTSRPGYIAGEWFYLKNGQTTAYQPISIAVKSDLNVFRDWTSSTVVTYEVHYYKKDTTEKVAASDTGWMFDGMTKTFQAKGGGDDGLLFDAYKNGFYPMVSSTSIIARQGEENIVIFEYVEQTNNPYVVKYVDKDGKDVAPQKTVLSNANSVVTETYVPVNGYMPDAYYKQLTLAYNPEQNLTTNVITFVYTEATNSAYYAIEYYYMNPDGETNKLNAKIQSPVEVGSSATIPNLEEDGFYFVSCYAGKANAAQDEMELVTDTTLADANVVVPADGALIQVYYGRKTTKYKVNYYNIVKNQDGSEHSLRDSKIIEQITDANGSQKDILFGTQITEEAIDIEGYSLISEPIQTKELVYVDLSDPSKNVFDYNYFSFYYEETIKTAEYLAVVSDERMGTYQDEHFNSMIGYATITSDRKLWSQPYDSVTAVARKGFYFDGWYEDADCTVKFSEEPTIQPNSSNNITYYALFKPYYSSLEIQQITDDLDHGQSFVCHVSGVDPVNSYVDMTITFNDENSSIIQHLPFGRYKVTQKLDWALNYQSIDNEQMVNVVDDSTKNKVVFNNQKNEQKWLTGDSYNSIKMN